MDISIQCLIYVDGYSDWPRALSYQCRPFTFSTLGVLASDVQSNDVSVLQRNPPITASCVFKHVKVGSLFGINLP